MKNLISLFLLICFVSLTASAQISFKVDSVKGNSMNYTPSAARGFGNWKWLSYTGTTGTLMSPDAVPWKTRKLRLWFTNAQDSIKIQGLASGNHVSATQSDSAVDLVLKLPIVGAINTGAGGNQVRDTLVTWIAGAIRDSPVWVDLSAYPFKNFRICTGYTDSGYVRYLYIKER